MADERKRDPYDIVSIFEQMALDLINFPSELPPYTFHVFSGNQPAA
jgi:hypothetical protein